MLQPLIFCAIFFLTGFSVHAHAEDDSDLVYRKELLRFVEETNASVYKATSWAAARESLELLKTQLEQEATKSRAAFLDSQKRKQDIERSAGRDAEAQKIWITLRPVFEATLKPSFQKNKAEKKEVCEYLARDIRFSDVGHMPDGTKISDEAQGAIALVEKSCEF